MLNPGGGASFKDGDLVFIDPDRPAINGSLVVARLEGCDECTFKKLIIEDGAHYLRALNPHWPTPIIPIDSRVTICGVAIFKGEPL